ncbi:hypothetical protein [Ktedonobacter racemifer]|uniref:Uncharacterized protein n=1 Tax=Ktedonobacter racemifer DSM 44963 TaxID=485913 RepID=D6TEV0_KTERA|nr:hypothetical protein [Ktedonobacter racemifer]EFH88549.1 hypothetical protein Krac_10024 [Ktedonobacter racemifer DSM 44963]
MENEYQRDQNLNGELGGEPQRDLGAEQGTEKKGLFERAKELFQKPSERHDQDVTQSDVPQRDEDLAGRSWQGDAGAYEQDQGVKQRPSQGDVTQQQNINQEPLQGGIPQQDQDVSGMGQRDVYERDQDLNQGQGPLAGRDRDVTQNRDVSQAPWSGQQFDNQPEENFSTEPTKQTESGFDLIRERDDEPRSAGSTGATGVTGNEPYTQRGTQGDITENRPPDVERRPDDLIDKAKDKLQGFFGNPDDPSPER